MRVCVVPTGTANLASVLAALRRLGTSPLVTADPDEIAGADRVVVPGVGSFGAAARSLDDAGVRSTLVARVEAGAPTLSICVGLQLLCSRSEESPGAAGLGLIVHPVRRFTGDMPVPQLGWNRVEPAPDSRFLTPGWAYFANSYRLSELPDGWTGARADYGGSFVAGLERGDVLACQFHPELSGAWGAGVLRRWLTGTRGGS